MKISAFLFALSVRHIYAAPTQELLALPAESVPSVSDNSGLVGSLSGLQTVGRAIWDELRLFLSSGDSAETSELAELTELSELAEIQLSELAKSPQSLQDDTPRLLQFSDSPEDLRWVRESDKSSYIRRGVRFMDITEDYGKELYTKGNINRATPDYPIEMRHKENVAELIKQINVTRMEDTLTRFSAFFSRYYRIKNGLVSSLWLQKQLQSIVKHREDITIEAFHHSWPQISIIATFKPNNYTFGGEKFGSGIKLPQRQSHSSNAPIVIVGAHLDSTNLLFPTYLAAPGADDDGSGTVTILEAFRLLVESNFKPDNVVQFHWYSAEEGGLLGSQAVFREYAERGLNVVAMLQQDMTGFTAKSRAKGQKDHIGIVNDNVSPELTEYTKSVVSVYCDVPYRDTKCGYACSDHASALKYGFPSAFAIESEFEYTNPFIHSTKDTIDRLDFQHMAEHVKLTLGYAYELAFAPFAV